MKRRIRNLSALAAVSVLLTGPLCLAIFSTPNLRGGWRFEENGGTTVTDLSSNGNNGTLVNSPTRVAGKFGQALSFNGANQYVSIPHSTSVSISGQITLAAWIKVGAFPTGSNLSQLMGKGSTGTTEAYYLRLNAAFSALEVGSWNGSTDYRAQTSYTGWTTGEWHHVVGMYDGANWIVYVDGVLKTSTAQAVGPGTSTQKVTIGARFVTAADRFFNGVIDEPRIYSKALTGSQVRSLMMGFEPDEY